MTKTDEAIHRYWALRPATFALLDKLELRQTHPAEQVPPELSLEVWLYPESNEYDDRYRLRVSFFGVEVLKLQPQGLVQFGPLAIKSIRDYGWEHLKYQVEDSESNQLSFYCKSFEARIEEVQEDQGDMHVG